MKTGSYEIGVRGSTCRSVFIVGAGAPGGTSGPWPTEDWQMTNDSKLAVTSMLVFMLSLV